MELIKLMDGGRILRLTEPKMALTVERRLDATKPVLPQKEQLMDVLEAALQRANALTA